MTNVFYLVLRRMRLPLLVIIVIYSISVFGLALTPGIDATGHPTPPMTLFDAFYVISYTATTIGFGELPTPFSIQQRMWMTLSIYLTVVGWSYSLITVLTLVQDRGFQATVRTSRFSRRVQALHEPFYIVCGGGETGMLICHGLDRLHLRFVVIDSDSDRQEELRLEEFRTDAPLLHADASQPSTLRRAGVLSPHCRGVMALADSDEDNQSIAVAVRLLAPRLPVLARIRDPEVETTAGVLGDDIVINPFERFAVHLASAVAAPERYRLREILTGLQGERLPPEQHPPRGAWIVCGYGRFGHSLAAHLREVGVAVTVVDQAHFGEPGVDVNGSGTDRASLVEAGIEHASGIVAANNRDMKNLAIAVMARQLKPDIFVVTRQNQTANSDLFAAYADDMTMVPSKLVAQEFLALITTPLLARYLELIPRHSEEYCDALTRKLVKLDHGRVPEVWSVRIDHHDAEAALDQLQSGESITVGDLIRDPYDRDTTLPVKPLLHVREGTITECPPPEQQLVPGDELLLTGAPVAQRRMAITLSNWNILDYVRTGHEGSSGLLWRALSRLGRRG